MRPIARQSARLASHARSASCSRVRQQATPRCAISHQQSRGFNGSIPRTADPKAPGDHEAWLAEQREQQRKIEAERDAKTEEVAEGVNGEAKRDGEARRSMRDRTWRRRRHTDVPKPPPIPDWFLKHNVTLYKDTEVKTASAEERQVMRCVDADTGHTLFTVPYYGLWPDDPTPKRMATSIRGQEIDVTVLGLDPGWLFGASEGAREELVVVKLIEQRAKDPGEVDLGALGELLVSLPRDLQDDVLRREASLRRRRGGGDDAPVKEPQLGKGDDLSATVNDQAASEKKPIAIPQISEVLGKDFFNQRSPENDMPSPFHQPSTSDQAPAPTKAVNDTEGRSGLDAQSWAFLEAETSVRAAFALVQDSPQSSSFASSRIDLSLHCPDGKAHRQMDDLVCDLANNVQADLIDIDANDIEDLTAEYVGSGRDEPGSFASIGYDAYVGYRADNGVSLLDAFSAPPSEDMQEDEPDEDDEEEDVEERGSGGTFPRSGLMTIEQLRKVLHDKRHDLSKALSGVGVTGVTVVGGPPPGLNAMSPGSTRSGRPYASADYVRWDDERLGALLDSLIDAPVQKEQVGATMNEPPYPEASAPSLRPTAHPALFRARAAESLIAHMRDSNPISKKWAATKLEYGSSDNHEAQSPGRRTIIHIRDLKDLCRSRLGHAVVQRIVQVVQKRRKSGQQVIVVGTTAQDHNNIFMSSPRDPEDFPFRSINIPPWNGKRGSELVSSVVPGLSKSYAKDGYARIFAVNMRHVQSMLRRLRPSQDVDLTAPKALYQMMLPGTHVLAHKVLSQNQVQRLVLTAIGLASEHAKSETVQPIHIALATDLTAKVDHIATSTSNGLSSNMPFPTIGGIDEGAAKPVSPANGKNDGKSSGKGKVEAIKSQCNQHEQRLLTGVRDADNIKVGFSDVHATPETIDALKMLTTLSLMRPEAFSYGVLAADRLPGLLLYGPPGTGKTMLAKAVAKESKATVLEVSGAQIYEKYVGEGEKMVRAVFSLAKKLSPCIVFIDEADAIFSSRSGPSNRNTHREIINQFLREWDGMDDHGVFIMVASNRPFDLDDAVLRRLPRRLLIDLPVAKDREAILGIHLKNEQLDSSVDLAKLAEQTSFYSGSDLKNLAVSAALAAVREENDLAAANASNPDFKLPEKRTLTGKHFEKAITEISASISEDMQSLTAIRKFDEQYGDRKGRRKKSGYGFGSGDAVVDESSVLVRQVGAQPPPPGQQPGAAPAP